MIFIKLHSYDDQRPILINLQEVEYIEDGPIIHEDVLKLNLYGVDSKGCRITLKSHKVIFVVESISFFKDILIS